MNCDRFGRIPASKVTVDGREYALTYVGSGTTCMVYRAEHRFILKEFSPIINGVCAMTRRGENLPCDESDDISDYTESLLERRRERFLNENSVIQALDRIFHNGNDNMLIVPEIKNTSLGECQICQCMEGETLSAILAELRRKYEAEGDFAKYFSMVISYAVKVFRQISIYHKHGYLNLDVKPDNLFAVNFDEYKGIRNIDFGSTRKADELIAEIESARKVCPNALFIASRMFMCSKPYYSEDSIVSTVEYCIGKNSYAKKIKALKSLDISAAWKILLYALCDEWVQYDPGSDRNDSIYLTGRLIEALNNKKISGLNSLSADYNIFSKLYFITCRINGNVERMLSAENVLEILEDIQAIVRSVSTADKTVRQRKAEILNSAYMRNDARFSDLGLETLEDVIDFCKTKKMQCGVSMRYINKIIALGEINFELFPDIICDGKRYTSYSSSKRKMITDNGIPFLRACNELKNTRGIILLGDGSIGKTTSMRVYLANLLMCGIPCHFYECKSLNLNDIDFMFSDMNRDVDAIYMFDAYDELQEDVAYRFYDLVYSLNLLGAKVIISSRSNPKSTQEKLFSDYVTMQILPFTDEQLDILTEGKVDKKSGYYTLLRNTMFLCLHLYLRNNGMVSESGAAVNTEAEFIRYYFEKLFEQKKNSFREHSLGEFVHMVRSGTGDRCLTADAIPLALKNIFSIRSTDGECGMLDSKQVKYLNYVHAEYITNTLLSYTAIRISDAVKSELMRQVMDITATHQSSEAFFYAGQLLRTHVRKNEILRLLNAEDCGDVKHYENILSFFLGTNDGVAEDIENVFTFCHPILRKDSKFNYIYMCDRIKVLSASSLDDIEFFANGLPNLERIEVNNGRYFSSQNCLLVKLGESGGLGVVLGCKNSIIPDGVTNVMKYAFAHCGELKSIAIPPSVTTVESFAFSYCDSLETVIIGEGVYNLFADAFYKCLGIRTLCIKNPEMKIGNKVRVQLNGESFNGIKKAIIPTTVFPYICYASRRTLEFVKVFRGTTQGNSVPLSVAGLTGMNSLRGLSLKNDIDVIETEPFINFKNVLERITVEKGNEHFYSENNCLVDVERKAVILGCKNSILPRDERVTQISRFAFYNCIGLKKLSIGDNIRRLGEKSFYGCESLETLELGTGIKEISGEAFYMCKSLKKVRIADLNRWMQVFMYTRDSNPIAVSRGVESDSLKDGVLTIDGDITHIREGAFLNCKTIKSIYVPSSVERIDGCAFRCCDNLKTVNIEDIGAWCRIAFKNRSANPLWNMAELLIKGERATNIKMDENIREVRDFAFANCPSIESVSFAGSGMRLGEAAFQNCVGLSEVTFDSFPERINPKAFTGCSVTLKIKGGRLDTLTELEGVKEVIYL